MPDFPALLAPPRVRLGVGSRAHGSNLRHHPARVGVGLARLYWSRRQFWRYPAHAREALAHYADQTSRGHTMSIIHRNYLPERKEPAFPRDLAVLIARRAAAMAEQFEDKATREMVTAARRRLRDGLDAAEVARQLGL